MPSVGIFRASPVLFLGACFQLNHNICLNHRHPRTPVSNGNQGAPIVAGRR